MRLCPPRSGLERSDFVLCAEFRMPAMKVGATRTGPASESRQGTNARAMVRGRRRAVGYGDLAEAEGALEGARWGCARVLLRLGAGGMLD